MLLSYVAQPFGLPKYTVESDEQPLNAFSLISINELGRFIETSDVQLQKTLSPIKVNELGRSIVVNLHFWKA